MPVYSRRYIFSTVNENSNVSKSIGTCAQEKMWCISKVYTLCKQITNKVTAFCVGLSVPQINLIQMKEESDVKLENLGYSNQCNQNVCTQFEILFYKLCNDSLGNRWFSKYFVCWKWFSNDLQQLTLYENANSIFYLVSLCD